MFKNVDQESIQPNFNFYVFLIYPFKLRHFKVQTIFSYGTNTQSLFIRKKFARIDSCTMKSKYENETVHSHQLQKCMNCIIFFRSEITEKEREKEGKKKEKEKNRVGETKSIWSEICC